MRETLRLLFAPPKLPLGDSTLWGICLTVLTVVLLIDLLTPASLVVGTLLTVPIALAALGTSRRPVVILTLLGVVASLLAALENALEDGFSNADLSNRVVSVLAILLVGGLTLRSRDASERALQNAEGERQLQRERLLRRLAEDMGGPLGQAEFVSRAASALQHLTGALSVEVGAVDKAMLRPPYALALIPELKVDDHRSRLDTRLPLEYLAQPVGAGDVWAVEGGAFVLARLRRSQNSDLLLILHRPGTPLALTVEAVSALQPLLERTALLDDLRVQRQQVSERGELLRDLVYAFSHDLRTPLLANAMNMEAAMRGAYGPLPEAYRATLENGLESNATLLALAEKLLLVTKYESGETDDEMDDVNLRALVQGVLEDLRPRIEASRLTVERDLRAVRLWGRPHDLRRAIQNLLDNAVKFSPPGTTLRVSLTDEDGEATLSVQDEGPGVSFARIPHLFQRFRGGGAGSGTGLGLYLTRRIAEAHGGSARYTRTGQNRSLFTLTLPVTGETPHVG
ncbi:sensor histidine kinase [Deinococcus arenicola]|uniref:histidine kinase n=1 Tax=Deinococcus arenicola TaxID=2994950 RepID=A0ABU4DTG8_9DEIO|nr:HAMP domain-containing sensor histidine kinase [Deinococcus sp. ZS9-10]MDV6375731.1 HAMP domain-containing sensor histidine kinase [Deinococcus sp. ZS9-10]